MINVGIAGVTGYTGIELVKLIANHPHAQIVMAGSNTYAGKSLTEVFPAMRAFESLICQRFSIDSLPDNIDVMFLALPHKVSMQHVPELLERGIKVIDLSADFRFSDADTYESVYQLHSAKHLLKESVYGLCEIYREQIKSASLIGNPIIGNPGCYPTSILLPLIPLLKERLIKATGIIADSKSGVSGAGRGLSLTTHFCEVNESFTPYKIGNHRHTPEINEVLSLQSGLKVSITFVPHLLPLTRGMLSTIYVQTEQNTTEQKIRDTYENWYGKEPFVRIMKKGLFPAISHVKGTNCCDIGIHFSRESGQLILVSTIDNLMKGAAGQAVQNMNIMFGLDEDAGLNSVSVPI
jgi:N-acetyl-gamma-glutamyl-phosphate reductase